MCRDCARHNSHRWGVGGSAARQGLYNRRVHPGYAESWLAVLGATAEHCKVLLRQHAKTDVNLDVNCQNTHAESCCAGGAGDVWYPQPAPKDHPWRTMPNQVQIDLVHNAFFPGVSVAGVGQVCATLAPTARCVRAGIDAPLLWHHTGRAGMLALMRTCSAQGDSGCLASTVPCVGRHATRQAQRRSCGASLTTSLSTPLTSSLRWAALPLEPCQNARLTWNAAV